MFINLKGTYNLKSNIKKNITIAKKDFGAMELVTVSYGVSGAEFKNHTHF